MHLLALLRDAPYGGGFLFQVQFDRRHLHARSPAPARDSNSRRGVQAHQWYPFGLAIDARGARFSELSKFMDSSRLDGAETFVDTKGLGIGESSDPRRIRTAQAH